MDKKLFTVDEMAEVFKDKVWDRLDSVLVSHCSVSEQDKDETRVSDKGLNGDSEAD